MNNQIVTLEKPGSVFFTAQYKLIWYKRDSAIFIENETSLTAGSVAFLKVLVKFSISIIAVLLMLFLKLKFLSGSG